MLSSGACRGGQGLVECHQGHQPLLRGLVGPDLPCDLPFPHRDDPVGDGEYLRQFRRDDQTAMPSAASLSRSSCTSAFAATSIPRVGSSTMSTLGSSESQRASTTFCWLPPGQIRDGLLRAGHRECSSNPGTVEGRLLLAFVDKDPARRKRPRDAMEKLLLMACCRNSACCLRSSGTSPMPRRMASRGERILTGSPSIAIVPRRRICPEDRSRHFRSPDPTKPASPRISPARTSRSTPRSLIACARAASVHSPRTSGGPAPPAWLTLDASRALTRHARP